MGAVSRRTATASLASAVAVLSGVAFLALGCGAGDERLRVFTARKIVTLDASRPEASAVAVEGGRIVGLGSLVEVEAALGDRAFTRDDTFANRVLVPGFIDPHVHPSLAAAVLQLEIVSAVEWQTPQGRTRAVRGHEAFLARLRALDAELAPGEWLLVWGYHAPYHGDLSRAHLDAVSSERPIFVWQRSIHEAYFNTSALEALALVEAEFDAHANADWKRGHLWEAGLLELAGPMLERLAAPTSYWRGLGLMGDVYHRGGLTTLGEQGFPQISGWGEYAMLRASLWWRNAPFRFALVPNGLFLLREQGGAAEAERAAARWLERSSDRVRFVKHMKYYADGAMFSQLMRMSTPYHDGHHGEWMLPPEEQAALLAAFWREGWGVHVHVNGDAGLDTVLDQIEAQQARDPAPGRRIVLEHYGYARPDQHRRVRELGIEVSNNPYYLHELAPIYAEHGLGRERAAALSPLGGLERAGVPTSYHSDFPMAPAQPLTLIWVAVNRIASDGEVWGAGERVSVERALRAVTLDAARSLGLESEIGSIEPGKRADFTVLERDPLAVHPREIKDIGIWGTVLGGALHPLTTLQ